MSSPYSCIPDSDALAELRLAWSWCLPASYEILLVSAFGDVFYERQEGGVYWLNTGTAETERVADDRADFQGKLRGEEGVEWLLPDLVDKLRGEGKQLVPGQCYTYAILPIFVEGKFETWNFKPVPVGQHFGLTAHLHKEISALPNGAKVRISVEP